jgi:hypothetical protein
VFENRVQFVEQILLRFLGLRFSMLMARRVMSCLWLRHVSLRYRNGLNCLATSAPGDRRLGVNHN